MDKINIKERIINNLMENYHITKNESLTLMVENIKEDEFNPRECEYTIRIDESNLFYIPVSNLCEYLKQLVDKYGDGELQELWEYDSEYFVYAYKDIENEDKIYGRIIAELYPYVNKYCISEQKKIDKAKIIKN